MTKIIVSGGGTAGHIYPALAVADALKQQGCEILFVGSLGKMEMERVPANGYEIVGLPVAGLQRRLTLKNLAVPFKLWQSMRIARKVIKQFRADVVVGFGGYASAPIVRAAQKAGIRTVIQEQNSYAGLTNRMLAKRADVICTAYEGMERFFPPIKITVTGNPLKSSIGQVPSRASAIQMFGLDPRRNTILVVGGSLGTRTLNEMMFAAIENGLIGGNVQVIWQTGKFYAAEIEDRLSNTKSSTSNIEHLPFIERMDMAYAASDVVICRAGASTISELQLLGKPAIFVPSPNVAGDHQTANARSLVACGAAAMVSDADALTDALPLAISLLGDSARLQTMSRNLKMMAKPYAAYDVASIVLQKRKKAYFIGVGGIGMSALARFFKHEGFDVAGYDRTRTPLTEHLEAEGIEVHYNDDVELIAPEFKQPGTRVIFTPAVPTDHKELIFFRQHGFEVLKRSQALGLLCAQKYVMAVAGTHGKSTVSTMVAWINRIASDQGSAFLGAISKNFKSNMVIGSGDRMAVEADEFDRSFLQLFPSVAVITSIDADHLDIYGTAENFHAAFEQFISQIKQCAIVKLGIDLPAKFRYSLCDSGAHYYAKNIELLQGGYYSFDIVTPTRELVGLKLGIPGLINVDNAVAAVAVVDQCGFDEKRLPEALLSFKGIERRFDFWINEPTRVYMDDYAHHPAEIRQMLGSVLRMFPGRHVTICFQPHLYTRTRDFAADFASALSIADRVILLPIYPAREEPISGVDSRLIYDRVTTEKMLVEKSELCNALQELDPDVVISAGAGDIDALRQSIFEALKR